MTSRISRLGIGRAVVVVPRTQEDQVRLEVRRQGSKDEGALRPHDGPASKARHEHRVDARDDAGVWRSESAHLHDLALDQLDPLVLVQNSGRGHALVLVDGEAAPAQIHRHLALSWLR